MVFNSHFQYQPVRCSSSMQVTFLFLPNCKFYQKIPKKKQLFLWESGRILFFSKEKVVESNSHGQWYKYFENFSGGIMMLFLWYDGHYSLIQFLYWMSTRNSSEIKSELDPILDEVIQIIFEDKTAFYTLEKSSVYPHGQSKQ